jgi:hypothetical protein
MGVTIHYPQYTQITGLGREFVYARDWAMNVDLVLVLSF